MANLTLEDIANISFPRANFGGYRAEDVDAFIDDVQVSYDNVLKESAELKRKLAILAQKVEEYRNEEDSIRNTLLSAQKLADASVREAKQSRGYRGGCYGKGGAHYSRRPKGGRQPEGRAGPIKGGGRGVPHQAADGL